MLRRRLLAAGLGLAASPAARAQKSAGTGPLRLGIDHALVESRLGLSLQTAFSADTGIAVKLVAGPALAVLEATKEGELDAALTNAPAAETALAQQALVHDRRAIAAGDFLIVGPAPRGRGQGRPAAGPRRGRGAGADPRSRRRRAGKRRLSLGRRRFRDACRRAGALARRRHRPGGALVRERRRLGRLRRQGASAAAPMPWSSVAPGRWPAAGLSVLADGDPLLAESVHAMRSFRATHPAGKIFIAWIGGNRGHAVVASHRGYRRPA